MYELKEAIEKQLVENLKYSSATIAKIKTSATLTSLLNSFGGTLIYDPNHPGAYHQGDLIVLGKPPYYNSLTTLAHELGHATGSYQAKGPNGTDFLIFETYRTAEEYSKARVRGEGEAIYFRKVEQEQSYEF